MERSVQKHFVDAEDGSGVCDEIVRQAEAAGTIVICTVWMR